jgi:hypothetical protein
VRRKARKNMAVFAFWSQHRKKVHFFRDFAKMDDKNTTILTENGRLQRHF